MLTVKEILSKEGIRNFQQDIRTMTTKQIKRYFSFKTTKKLNVTNLIKNLIWQAYTWISTGKMEIFEGNIRSFWYANVKSILSRLDLDVSGKRYTEKVYDAFVEMVAVYHLFRYIDFGFSDSRAHVRNIGNKNGNLLLFVEKDGLYNIVKRIAKKYDATSISLGGFSSYLTMEYLARYMAKRGLLREPIHLFGLLDYDPSGYWIGKEFQEQLKNYKIEIASFHTLLNPSSLPDNLVEIYKYRLKNSGRTKNWLKVSGGIGGKAFGLEADALGGRRIREVYTKAVEPYLGKKLLKREADVEKEDFFSALAETPGYIDEEEFG